MPPHYGALAVDLEDDLGANRVFELVGRSKLFKCVACTDGLGGVATVAQAVRGLYAAERAAGRKLVPIGGHAPRTALRTVHAAHIHYGSSIPA